MRDCDDATFLSVVRVNGSQTMAPFTYIYVHITQKTHKPFQTVTRFLA